MNRLSIWIVIFLVCAVTCQAATVKSESVYKLKPNDPEAVYFTQEFFNIKADGKTDVSGALQYAINGLKETRNFGILFIPEGSYLISKTIYVPPSVRLIGYGQNRPVFILGPKTKGFQERDLGNGETVNPMFMFTGNVVTPEQPAEDANAGTFYCAFSNIDIKIEKGNPGAIALRTHFAQHGFVSHCNLYIGDGFAGIYDVGNEMEDVKFFGGEYGIYTSMTSPSWPMMMVDTYFEGQRKAAIYCMNTGLTIVNLHARNIPVVVEIGENYTDRLFMEKCLFENIKDAGIVISIENNSLNQINLRDIYCTNVPVFTRFRISNTQNGVKENNYHVKDFTYGLVMADMTAGSEYKTIFNYESLENCPKSLSKDIPPLPAMDTWVNIRDLGAKGDGETDDTKVFQDAISKYDNIYVPQGWYRLTETLKLTPNTCLIGLAPYATQFLINESTPAFSGFGSPEPTGTVV